MGHWHMHNKPLFTEWIIRRHLSECNLFCFIQFLLAHIYSTRRVHCDNFIEYSELWTNSSSLLYALNPSTYPLFKEYWWISYYIHMNIYGAIYICYLHKHTHIHTLYSVLQSFSSSVPSPLALPPPTDPLAPDRPIKTLMSHYHHFRSRFYIWVKTCNNWHFELGLFSLNITMSSFIHFPANDSLATEYSISLSCVGLEFYLVAHTHTHTHPSCKAWVKGK
jgi:hypothetical protein